MKKLKALVTAEINRTLLEKELENYIDFEYAGYYVDHEVMPHDILVERIKDYEILICEYDTISEDVFEAATKLKIIICCRGGVKSVVDLNKAMEKKVIVCNNAGRNAGAVTDMVMGYILDLTRNISKTNMLIHSGTLSADFSSKPKEYQDTVWGLDNDSPFIRYRGRSINHMKLGIIGFGHAGRVLAYKAHVFGLDIMAYDPYANFDDKPDYVKVASWEEIITSSDIISVHCALTPQTKNMFGELEFMSMKDGVYFINTARGELVVEEDLVKAISDGKIAGAAIDVTRKEPIPADSILLGVSNLIITPHIAGSADDVQYCGTKMVIQSLVDYIEGRKPNNSIVYK